MRLAPFPYPALLRAVGVRPVIAASVGLALVTGLAAATAADDRPRWRSGAPASVRPGADGVRVVATNGRGAAVAAWTHHDGRHDRVQAAWKEPSGDWSAPTTLSAPGENADQVDVVIDDAGTRTVAWQRSDGVRLIVQAATSRAPGRWAVPVDLSRADGDTGPPRLATGPNGLTVAVWHRVARSRNDIRTVTVIESRVRPPGRGWGRARALTPRGLRADNPTAVVGGDGVVTVAWRARLHALSYRTVIQTRSLHPGQRWSAARIVSMIGSVADGARLAAGRRGEVALAWYAYDGRSYRAYARLKDAGSTSWHPIVRGRKTGRLVPYPDVRVGPSGRAVVTYPSGRARGEAAGRWATLDLSAAVHRRGGKGAPDGS